MAGVRRHRVFDGVIDEGFGNRDAVEDIYFFALLHGGRANLEAGLTAAFVIVDPEDLL